MESKMTIKEIDRLIDWLKDNGHTAEEILDCIKHIATEKNKKGSPTPTKAQET